mmetsp:Transcript_21377/g.39908  ORF Transcript_21377/g.39908 Transcript_21377/m.39908 type:complete len:271 (+) Transcript_21377:722-1534(+)
MSQNELSNDVAPFRSRYRTEPDLSRASMPFIVIGALATTPFPAASTRTVCMRQRGIYCSRAEKAYAVTAFPAASRRLSDAKVMYSPRSLTEEGIRTASRATIVEELHTLDKRVMLCNKISARQNLAIFNPFALIVLIASLRARVFAKVFVDVIPNRLRILSLESKREESFRRLCARHAAFMISSSEHVLNCASSMPANSKKGLTKCNSTLKFDSSRSTPPTKSKSSIPAILLAISELFRGVSAAGAGILGTTDNSPVFSSLTASNKSPSA